ncbi:MAG TPA: acyl-CoA dehydrogenase family protein [Frankiaceae bacterium]|jgi:alkylation response protein AidB-like acyl-CoA dehydrogenase|nr:acyl-CoA dehydrogenase family protein [Frankiaceae bacterium]
MLVDLTSDQEFFRQTTAKFLESQVPIDAVRALRDDPAGFQPDFWRRGAELGWASLLVTEEFGGGTISGGPLVDLTLIAHEFGQHAAPGPLVPVNVVASALSAAGTHADVLESLMSGESIASWAVAERATSVALDGVRLTVSVEGDALVLNGEKRPVESAAQASHLLVTGRSDSGLTQVLVPTQTAGITISPMGSVDLTRRFGAVRFDNVRLPLQAVVGEVGGAGPQVERQLQIAVVAHNAEAVGAMQSAFDMTVAWAFDRYSFGRPLASYQEIKHRFADMLSWLQASHAINDAAAVAFDAGAAESADLVSAAKAYIGDHSTELLHDCVQMHGGIGVTFEHDVHLYLRRVTINRALYGTPPEHRQRLAARLVAGAGKDAA